MNRDSVADHSALINLNTGLQPRIFVTSLDTDDSSATVSSWINADQHPDDLYKAIKKLFGERKWAIHDYKGFCGISLAVHPDLERVSELATFIVEYADLGAALLVARYPMSSEGIARATDALEKDYRGLYDSEEAFVRASFLENYSAPNALDRVTPHVNFKSMAKDWFTEDFFAIPLNGKVHVFERKTITLFNLL